MTPCWIVMGRYYEAQTQKTIQTWPVVVCTTLEGAKEGAKHLKRLQSAKDYAELNKLDPTHYQIRNQLEYAQSRNLRVTWWVETSSIVQTNKDMGEQPINIGRRAIVV